jgi:hypothetical protein
VNFAKVVKRECGHKWGPGRGYDRKIKKTA